MPAWACEGAQRGLPPASRSPGRADLGYLLRCTSPCGSSRHAPRRPSPRTNSGTPPWSRPSTPTRRRIRRLDEGDKIYDLYYWKEVLQEEGNGGKVVVCRAKAPPGASEEREFVMKIRAKADLRRCHLEDLFRRSQERMLNLPSHPGVVHMHEVFEDEAFYYVVMEKALGGPLLRSLVRDFRDGCMPASAVRRLLREVLEAVGHLHAQGVLHRDIKPDNLAVQLEGDAADDTRRRRKRVMLIDFDHADPDWDPAADNRREGKQEVFGTLRFSAPEALMGVFTQQSDLYSVGAVLHLLMTGRFPYSEDTYTGIGENGAVTVWQRTSLRQRMAAAHPDFSGGPWPGQPACRDLCRSLLAFEASDRPASAEEALRHRWFLEPAAGEQ